MCDSNMSNKYKAEAFERWGETEGYRKYSQKTKGYTKEKWEKANNSLMAVFAEFADCKVNGDTADSSNVQGLVKKLQSHITTYFYNCTDAILADLGRMYVGDDRFKKNIEKYGDGTAEFAATAIDAYCRKS